MYKIFISYHIAEQELADKVKTLLNNAYRGKVSFFLASEQILPGDNWKLVLKQALKDFDAILTIVTPKYLKRPWIFIEWTAFWLNDKTTLLLRTNDVLVSDLAVPMQDSQSAELFREDDIKKLFEKITKEVNSEFIPFDFAMKLARECEAIYTKLIENELNLTFEIYKSDISKLPNDNDFVCNVFWHYYNKNDITTATQIFIKIPSEIRQSKTLIELLEKGDLNYTDALIDEIPTNKSNLVSLFRKVVVESDNFPSLIQKIISHVYDSGTAMRKFAMALVDLKMYDTEIMKTLIYSFHRMAELQAVGRLLIDLNLYNEKCFYWSIEVFKKRQSTDYSGLLRYSIDQKTYLDKNFNFIEKFKILVSYSQSSAKKTLLHIINSGERNLARQILELGLLDDNKTQEVYEYINGEQISANTSIDE